MHTERIDGGALAAQLQASLALQVSRFLRPPCLAVVLVTDDPRQQRHAALKHQAAASVGIRTVACDLPPGSDAECVRQALDGLVADPAVDGVFLQLPLPDHLDAQTLHDRLPATADVDGLGRANRAATAGGGVHRPAAVDAVLHVLAHLDVGLAGRRAVVVGTSWDLGAPLHAALSAAGASVEALSGATPDLAVRCRRADVIVTTAGIPHLIDDRCTKPGAVVVDAGGGTATAAGPVGDVDLTAVDGLASLVVPHPGGIGPLTVACLLRSTVAAAAAG